MALTGKEVGRAATTGAVGLLLVLLTLVLNDRSGPGTSAADDGRGSLELLPPSPTLTPTPAATPTTASTPTVAPTAPPTAATGTTAPLAAAPSPTRIASAVPSASSGPVTVVVVTPTPPATAAPTPGPVTTTPTGRVQITSDLPTGCGRLGQACRYAEAPAAARLGDGPASVGVTSPGQGALRVTATAGAGGSPASVGFVIRVCRCTDTADDVLVEARVSLAPGSVLELQGISGPARIWVQELNEAGLSRGVFADVPATPAQTPTP